MNCRAAEGTNKNNKLKNGQNKIAILPTPAGVYNSKNKTDGWSLCISMRTRADVLFVLLVVKSSSSPS
jgi:hypothetical protein